MLSRLAGNVQASACRPIGAAAGCSHTQVRGYIQGMGAERWHYPQWSAGNPLHTNTMSGFTMVESDFFPPDSEKPMYNNVFEQIPDTRNWHKSAATAIKPPAVHSQSDIMEANSGDPHQLWGFGPYRYAHYKYVKEPTFPRKPDLSRGELASGANLIRTDVWHTPNEPAIVSIGRFSPDNFRAAGYADNAPCPDTAAIDHHLDFRTNRLKIGHADRRPWTYMVGCMAGVIGAAFIRGFACKMVYTLWPDKSVFAASIVEVDLRPVRVGQNFVIKWRGKPIFIKRRTEEQIQLAVNDDKLVGSMRDPETDKQRVKNPEYLIILGVCTHLGCIPFPDTGDWGGYFCPCHGSHYDHSGRIRRGPAPANMEVPPHEYIDDYTVKIG